MDRIKTKVIEIWRRWRTTFVSTILLSFLMVPLVVNLRDRLYKRIIDPSDYALSVIVCAPILVESGDLISQNTGQKIAVPPSFIPTPFSVLLRNDGSRFLEDNEFLIIFSKDDSHPEVSDATEPTITDIVLASRSPLDRSGVSAKFNNNQLRISAKRLNPGDFIYGEGTVSRPISVDVFSRSIGLTAHETRGPAECPILSIDLGNVFAFFTQKEHESTVEDSSAEARTASEGERARK
jgi:hypothetical protein